MVIFKQSRLSVVPVTAEELEVVAALGKKKA
jgi:predicted RNA-binding protein with PUA-like domain